MIRRTGLGLRLMVYSSICRLCIAWMQAGLPPLSFIQSWNPLQRCSHSAETFFDAHVSFNGRCRTLASMPLFYCTSRTGQQ